MENERREESQPEPVSPQSEPPRYEEREPREEPAYARSDDSESAGQPTFSAEGNISSSEPGSEPAQAPSGETGGAPQDRGGNRGRRGRRLPPRNRERGRGGRDRRGGGGGGGGREREQRSGFAGGQPHGGGNYQQQQQHGQHGPGSRDLPPEGARETNRPQGGGSLLNDARLEVERIREVLEGVLRDLDDVAEQLSKAEHERDIAETEIEQLRDSLRRLHR